MKKLLILLTTLFALVSCGKKPIIEQINKQVNNAKPGDVIVIPNGVYKDVSLQFYAKGTAGNPILIKAEEAGKVLIQGASNLRLAGEFVIIEGLYFTNGYSPQGAAIEFRLGDEVANNCRITNCVIEDYNPSDRSASYAWVTFYGRYNRFDHNCLVGKQNAEATLVVALDEARNQQNLHQIDHNYFGRRPNYGSNGGETMRVGNSQYAHTASFTQIEDNYFEHCSGEVEIISIKAANNVVQRNTFFECEGSVVLRHGADNTVACNKFLGNGKPHTGGVRIINANQTVSFNYFEGLTGTRFRAPLAIMNSVPNPQANRYHQVENAKVEGNIFVNCVPIELSVGADNERTVRPKNVWIMDNIFTGSIKQPVFLAFDKIDGYTFKDNSVAIAVELPAVSGFSYATKFKELDFSDLPTKDQTGASWYDKNKKNDVAEEIITVEIAASQNSLLDALNKGNKIILTEAKQYFVDASLVINKPVEIVAAGNLSEKPEILYNGKANKTPIIQIADGGLLTIKGIILNGKQSDGRGQAISAVSPAEVMSRSYKAKFDDCEFGNFGEGNMAGFKAFKNTLADTLVFTGCYFFEISGQGIDLAAEKDDNGRYSAEYLKVDNCRFYKILGCGINLYRGGTDESTTGPRIDLSNSLFTDVNNQERGAAMRLLGVQVINIDRATFENSGCGGGSIRLDETPWDKINITNCMFNNSGKIQSYSKKW